MEKAFSSSDLLSFIRKLHALVGIFIGPFIIVASLTGALYAMAFALENWMYEDILYVKDHGTAQSLNAQVAIADKLVMNNGVLFAIRPGSSISETTRVIYTDPQLGSSEYRTIFIDPNNLDIKADITTYGSSGSLPFRKTIDYIHRDLFLGKWGRPYSEAAASWLWITGLSGLFLYLKRNRIKKNTNNSYQKNLRFHSYLGIFCFVALIMLSITGLTWSQWAGGNISEIREAMSWQTPALNKKILTNESLPIKKDFDQILKIARDSGIDANRIEVRPSANSQSAWMVGEIERGFPTQVDSVAIDPLTLAVTDKIDFSTFPLMAKLTRWGIDLHMGSLFGLANQIILIVMALTIIGLGVTGYVLWFKRKAWRAVVEGKTLYLEFSNQLFLNKIIIFSSFILLGTLMPLIFVSLIVFVIAEESFKVAFHK